MTAFDLLVLRRLRSGIVTLDGLHESLRRHYRIDRDELTDTLYALKDSGHVTVRGGTRWEATT